jgi:hypothetical protein
VFAHDRLIHPAFSDQIQPVRLESPTWTPGPPGPPGRALNQPMFSDHAYFEPSPFGSMFSARAALKARRIRTAGPARLIVHLAAGEPSRYVYVEMSPRAVYRFSTLAVESSARSTKHFCGRDRRGALRS